MVRRTGRAGQIAEISLAVPSDFEYVGEAVELLASHLGDAPLSPRRLQFNLRTAVAEALANAIAYGNHHDPAKLVRVLVDVRAEAVHIHVTDDGAKTSASFNFSTTSASPRRIARLRLPSFGFSAATMRPTLAGTPSARGV